MPSEPPRCTTVQSNIEWQAWDNWDPLYGVWLAPGRNRRGKNPWTAEEFYAPGPVDWAIFAHHWEQYGTETGSCVEIASGAGRMTCALSRILGHMHGCDVSPGMIETAKAALKDLPNVSLYLTDGQHIPLPDGAVSAALSTIVFQHFTDPAAAIENFAEV